MQIIINFNITMKKYIAMGKSNCFPELSSCPICMAQKPLERHGYYTRNAGAGKVFKSIFIARYLCTCCEKTISLLPSFLHPRFQYTLGYIQLILEEIFLGKKALGYYQLQQFYRKRFLKNLHRLQAFFRDSGNKHKLPSEPIKKAIKLLEMIRKISGIQTLSLRFWDHFGTAFMAL